MTRTLRRREPAYILKVSLAEVSEARLNVSFNKVEQGYQIIKTFRDMCVFAKQDLVRIHLSPTWTL